MSNQGTPLHPPRGLSRLMWRLPIWLYRLKLGWVLTDHFLLLEHTGRKSGRTRYAVIEVIRHDRQTDSYYVAAGFGSRSDWVQNLQRTPRAAIRVGRRKLAVIARRLPDSDSLGEIKDYARRHPTAFRSLLRILGYHLEETEESYRGLSQWVPVIQLKPDKR